MKHKLTIYRDAKSEYRWQVRSKGRIVAESGEGYKRLNSLRATLVNLLADMSGNMSWALDVVKDAVDNIV